MTDDSMSLVPHQAGVQWYFDHEGVHGGPLSAECLQEEARRGKITPDTLVWQVEYESWLEASRVPMLATILGCQGEPDIQSSRVEPIRPTADETAAVPEPAAGDETTPEESSEHAALGDAVSDDEVVDTFIDIGQAREILERASHLPPEPFEPVRLDARSQRSSHPSEPWLPPASVASTPAPAPDSGRRLSVGLTRQLSVVGGCIAAGVVALLIAAQQHRAPRPALGVEWSVGPLIAASSIPSSAQPQSANSGFSAVEARSTERPSPRASGEATAESRKQSPTTDSPSRPLEWVVVTEGPLDASVVQSMLERALPVFDAQCWQRYHNRLADDTKDPSVRLELSVDHLGRVSDIKSSKAPPGYRGVTHCIVGRMRGWKFPRANQDSHAIVIVPRKRRP